MKPPKDIPATLRNIEMGYKTAAKVVAKYGDAYLPIFERMHTELETAKKQEQMRQLAMTIATQIRK